MRDRIRAPLVNYVYNGFAKYSINRTKAGKLSKAINVCCMQIE